MARINSKTGWIGSDRPLPQDLNRIESNNEQAFSELDVVNSELDVVNSEIDVVNSEIDVVNSEIDELATDLATETNARIAGDNARQLLPTTSTDPNLTNFPIGTCIIVISNAGRARNSTRTLYFDASSAFNAYSDIPGGTALEGTWITRGWTVITVSGLTNHLYQRVS